jgi:hypothetical protein
MTDAQKVEALTDLLGEVMHSLNMKQYVIDDPTESYKCETQADDYHQKMIDILHSEDTLTTGTQDTTGAI